LGSVVVSLSWYFVIALPFEIGYRNSCDTAKVSFLVADLLMVLTVGPVSDNVLSFEPHILDISSA